MVGGKTKQNVINGILGKIFSNELSVKCSWQGKKGNFPVVSTNIIALIKGISGFHIKTPVKNSI